MDPRDAAVDPADSRREQHRVRLARLPTTLLPSMYRHSGGLHRQEIPPHVKNEVPRDRSVHRGLRTTCPKSPLSPRIARDESTVHSRTTERRRRRRHAISYPHYLPRAHREGPRKCTLEGTTPKRIWRK